MINNGPSYVTCLHKPAANAQLIWCTEIRVVYCPIGSCTLFVWEPRVDDCCDRAMRYDKHRPADNHMRNIYFWITQNAYGSVVGIECTVRAACGSRKINPSAMWERSRRAQQCLKTVESVIVDGKHYTVAMCVLADAHTLRRYTTTHAVPHNRRI